MIGIRTDWDVESGLMPCIQCLEDGTILRGLVQIRKPFYVRNSTSHILRTLTETDCVMHSAQYVVCSGRQDKMKIRPPTAKTLFLPPRSACFRSVRKRKLQSEATVDGTSRSRRCQARTEGGHLTGPYEVRGMRQRHGRRGAATSFEKSTLKKSNEPRKSSATPSGEMPQRLWKTMPHRRNDRSLNTKSGDQEKTFRDVMFR
jgi:hypothetical protein